MNVLRVSVGAQLGVVLKVPRLLDTVQLYVSKLHHIIRTKKKRLKSPLVILVKLPFKAISLCSASSVVGTEGRCVDI